MGRTSGRSRAGLASSTSRLARTEKLAALGQLLAGVAHEINTPVTAIVGNIEPISRTLAALRSHLTTAHDDEGTRLVQQLLAMFDVLARGAERTAAVVSDLRAFSRSNDRTPVLTDVHQVLDVCLRLLRPRWHGRITIHPSHGVPLPVHAAEGQLHQVFLNLLANACDAITGDGNIWITTTHTPAGELAVTVRDDGCGMSPDQREHAFDPFFTTKAAGHGTGLGLSITAEIVHAHGGSIDLHTAPGVGTTFTVRLPQHGGQQHVQLG